MKTAPPAVALPFAAAVALTAHALPAAAQDQQPIKIGVIGEQSAIAGA